ncbi:MAG: helix-turn-helix domain-containing protein [Chitinophagaceae bacterium]
MKTFFIKPHLKLQRFVKYIQVIEQTQCNGINEPLQFYAEGYPGIIFLQTDQHVSLQNASSLSPFCVYGQTVKPLQMMPEGNFRMIVLGFYPHIIKPLFCFNSNEITDNCIDLRLTGNKGLSEVIDRFQHAVTLNEQVELISNYLFDLYTAAKADPGKALTYAVTHIMESGGQTSLKNLRSYLQVPERTFERRFEHYVGVGPKLFARICQFQSSLQQLQQRKFTKLSDIAYENGFADQSHFIRAFSEFTGYAPLEFLKRNNNQDIDPADYFS